MGKKVDRVAVVGGGAAGLAAAICAARAGSSVTVFERNERVGNSIRVTGDGRCNIANARTRAEDYRNPSFVERAFSACSPAQAIAFLESTGLLLRQEAEGRLYPYANKSTSVIDALRLSARRAGVREECGIAVAKVEPVRHGAAGNDAGAHGLGTRCAASNPAGGDPGAQGAGVQGTGGPGGVQSWRIVLANGSSQRFDRVVLACGHAATADLLPERVPFSALQPVLGPLVTNAEPLRGLDKVRAKCALRLGAHREVGEATFRANGISGIAAFNMSRFAKPGDELYVDFLPTFEGDSLAFLQERLTSMRGDVDASALSGAQAASESALQVLTWLDFTCGMLLPLVARAVLRAAGLDPDARAAADGMAAFDGALRAFPLQVRGMGDARLCQVHRGGASANAIDPFTMQVREAPGLFAVGEMLDVDGPCGGYNLHWAWVSGIIAGQAAAGARHTEGGRGAGSGRER